MSIRPNVVVVPSSTLDPARLGRLLAAQPAVVRGDRVAAATHRLASGDLPDADTLAAAVLAEHGVGAAA